jgi:hypothetical protein
MTLKRSAILVDRLIQAVDDCATTRGIYFALKDGPYGDWKRSLDQHEAAMKAVTEARSALLGALEFGRPLSVSVASAGGECVRDTIGNDCRCDECGDRKRAEAERAMESSMERGL